MHELQFIPGGFEWVETNQRKEGIIAYKRIGKDRKNDVIIILNLTPVVRKDWKLKVYGKASCTEIFNSDSKQYWGTGDVFNPAPEITLVEKNTDLYEINLHLPALASIILR